MPCLLRYSLSLTCTWICVSNFEEHVSVSLSTSFLLVLVKGISNSFHLPLCPQSISHTQIVSRYHFEWCLALSSKVDNLGRIDGVKQSLSSSLVNLSLSLLF